MATQDTRVFAFGCEDAAFLTAGNPPAYTDIYGVQQAEFAMEVSKVDVEGDDDILTNWLHSQKAKVTLKHAVLDLDVYEKVTGNEVTISGGDYSEVLLGTDEELEPPPFALRLKLKAKTTAGVAKSVYLFIYNITGSIKMEGIKFGEKVAVTIEGDCYRSSTDENGTALASAARGKLQIAPSV